MQPYSKRSIFSNEHSDNKDAEILLEFQAMMTTTQIMEQEINNLPHIKINQKQQPFWKTLTSVVLGGNLQAEPVIPKDHFKRSRQSTSQNKRGSMKRQTNPIRRNSLLWAIKLLSQKIIAQPQIAEVATQLIRAQSINLPQPQQVRRSSMKKLLMDDKQQKDNKQGFQIFRRKSCHCFECNYGKLNSKQMLMQDEYAEIEMHRQVRLKGQLTQKITLLIRARNRKDTLSKRTAIIKQVMEDENKLKEFLESKEAIYEQHQYLIEGDQILRVQPAKLLMDITQQKTRFKQSKTSIISINEDELEQYKVNSQPHKSLKESPSKKIIIYRPQNLIYGSPHHHKTITQYMELGQSKSRTFILDSSPLKFTKNRIIDSINKICDSPDKQYDQHGKQHDPQRKLYDSPNKQYDSPTKQYDSPIKLNDSPSKQNSRSKQQRFKTSITESSDLQQMKFNTSMIASPDYKSFNSKSRNSFRNSTLRVTDSVDSELLKCISNKKKALHRIMNRPLKSMKKSNMDLVYGHNSLPYIKNQ